MLLILKTDLPSDHQRALYSISDGRINNDIQFHVPFRTKRCLDHTKEGLLIAHRDLSEDQAAQGTSHALDPQPPPRQPLKNPQQFQLQVPFTKKCCGSASRHGWLATIEDRTDQGLFIALRNPFNKKLQLVLHPPLNKSIPGHNTPYHITSIRLSADPSMNPDNYVVVALFGGWLSSKQVRGFGLTSIFHIAYLLTLYFIKANSKLLSG
ncbi:unnamed protein product [Malus baccata var. baccata]